MTQGSITLVGGPFDGETLITPPYISNFYTRWYWDDHGHYHVSTYTKESDEKYVFVGEWDMGMPIESERQ